MSKFSSQKGWCLCLKNLLKATLLFLFASPSFAQTNVSGNQSGLWSKANSPYILNGGGVTVPAGQTLLVEPGVEIRSTNPNDRVIINGTLIAQGTVTDTIRFTNYSTNGLTQEGALFFAAGSTSSVMDYVSFDSWGNNYHGDNAAIYIQDGSPAISHSTIRNSYSRGIYITSNSGTPTLTNNNFTNNPIGIETTTATSLPTISGINFTNNATGIYAYASQMLSWNR